uniref:L-gulonolactone oxidase n=1 Tax=Leersia perrieri TaxID=77586 RepID=A0A0D9W3U6_9ORYZ
MIRRLLPILFQSLTGFLVILLLWLVSHLAVTHPPPGPIVCTTTDGPKPQCTVTNTYGAFPDRTICHVGNVTYPRTEDELVAAVAAAVAARRKVKVVTRYSNSFPKLACPGEVDGTAISTRWLNRMVHVDVSRRLMTVESGVSLHDLVRDAAAHGLALPHSPYWSGLTIGGVIATGAHGSSIWGKGSAVHEYVVGMRIVTPAPASDGFAVVREIDADDPDLDAAKVSLGVLGAVSQVTLALEPMFKRSVHFVRRNDSDIVENVAVWGGIHEFGDIMWLPRQRRVVYREDDRVDVSLPGDGRNDIIGFRPAASLLLLASRAAEEWLEERGSDVARCLASHIMPATQERLGFGFTNDDGSVAEFTGSPLVGYHHNIQSSASCMGTLHENSRSHLLSSSCMWNARLRTHAFYNSGYSIALSCAPAFVADVARLRDAVPAAFCQIDSKMGLLMRYVKASSAYLGKAEDSVDFDVTYYRSYTRGMPRAHADVYDEIEQMALRKYGGLPHWGKNRNFAFDGVVDKYPNVGDFIKVKDRFDPDGFFSSEWSDQVLGIRGSPVIFGDGCAMEGLCVCSDDSHCAPEKGYFCRPGKVFTEARVCSLGDAAGGSRVGNDLTDA